MGRFWASIPFRNEAQAVVKEAAGSYSANTKPGDL
jgi:hypothetical protein